MNESSNVSVKSMMGEPHERRTVFRRDIQGLRAIAVLAVMLFHACKTWLPSGFVGVDVFFVISGYIICTLIIDGKDKFSWSTFYWGRAKRIIPAYSVMLAIISIVSSFLFLPSDFNFFKKSIEAAAVFNSNQYFSEFGSYFAPGAYELPLLHTWSLAIEMQFYLFFPILVIFTPRKHLMWVLSVICMALFVYAEWELRTKNIHDDIYYSLIARIPEFLLGAVIAVGGVGQNWSLKVSSFFGWLGLALLIFSVIYINELKFPGFLSIVPCMATALIIASRTGAVNQLLSTKVLVWIGGLSYSLYLWHWPVLAFMRYYNERYELTGSWILVFVFATFLLAWMSFRWVENPARKKTNFLAKPSGLGVLLTVAAIMMIVSPIINKYVEAPMPIELTRYASPDAICHGRIVGECLRGNQNNVKPLIVLGDSHAAQLNEFFDVVGSQENIAARVITASNCVPIPGFDVDRIPEYSRADCRSQIEALAPFIDQANTIVIAAMWEWQAPNPAFLHALSNFLEYTTKRNINVLVLAQIPMFDFNPLRVRRFAGLGLPIRVGKNERWERANSDIAEMVANFKGAEFLDFSHSSFFASAPFYSGTLIYMDSHHLNEQGSRDYGMFAAPFIKKHLTSSR